jgi:Lhr-like helicase
LLLVASWLQYLDCQKKGLKQLMINPLVYMEKVVRSFLRYQLTTYPFADRRLNDQMRKLLSLEETRDTPLLKGPYISLSRAFASGATVDQLVKEKVLHPHLKQIVNYPSVYGHQEEAIRAIQSGQTTLVSTGTGSGKSECFLYPIISKCLDLRDKKAPAGICAVIVYPMNALAEDQLGRLRELLAGSGIPFGMYVGKTPEKEADVAGLRLKPGSSRADYTKALADVRESNSGVCVHPPEEMCSRAKMREPGGQPRILLTNVKQLELLLTRQKDIELFDGARLDYLVFDEAHTFSGAEGAETACLIRRLRSYCGRLANQTVCVATSATIFDPKDPEAARTFASRFFGVEAKAVATVREVFEQDVWADKRSTPVVPKKSMEFLDQARSAIDCTEPAKALSALFKAAGASEFNDGDWEAVLHDKLSANELLFQAAALLEKPKRLADLVIDLGEKLGRKVSEEELIGWLTLGAAARKEGRPLVRPVVHAFVRGVPGAVVTFEDEMSNEPTLHLSAEDDPEEKHLRLPVLTCTTCGQHYFEHYLGDLDFTAKEPGGGIASAGSRYWESLTKEHSGIRVLLLDRLISSIEEEEENAEEKLSPLYICRRCGAAHIKAEPRCHSCGEAGLMLKLFAVKQKADQKGFLPSCVCCGALGRSIAGKFRESARPVRAVNVSDVHVLAQDMVQHAERKRLLVFADNRQDAAFQAGWMRDHARRFRFRALVASELKAGALSVGDVVHRLDKIMEEDDALSMALLPELWAVASKEAGGSEHRECRRSLLRNHLLIELTIPMRQMIGLEPWGRIKINYVGIDQDAPFIRQWAKRLKLPGDELLGGVAAFLDQLRRRKILFDSLGQIFSKVQQPGSRELESGFLPPLPSVPQGLKFTRDVQDNTNRVMQWHSPGHQTTASQIARKWGVETEETEVFLQELWNWLRSKDVELLVPVVFRGGKGNALPQCAGTHQINGDRLMMVENSGSYRCRTCRQQSVRRTPGMKCLAWRCDGALEFVPEDADNYDLQLLDGQYDMLRPREHTAMVPSGEREKLEQIFKGDSDAVNTLVCTQTLELGVDIGSLDAILMRNVPPLCANYWQRAGRAGRRHRMAVDITYCRLLSHDRAYFNEPDKMLSGPIDPPAFNLSNDLMVKKHVHATVLTALQSLTRANSGLGESERQEIADVLKACFPTFIGQYLFEGGLVLDEPRDVSALRMVIEKHKAKIEAVVAAAFKQGWPVSDAAVVENSRLTANVVGMADELAEVVKRLHRRLKWAMSQMHLLQMRQRKEGALDEEAQSFYNRCHRFVGRLKNARVRGRAQAEGVNDVVTLGVLAAEGFLPGYGLESGSVIGMAEVPKWVRGLSDFDLPRTPSVAIREYVPGNLLYANGQRFVARRYARDVGEDQHELIRFEVFPERQALQEIHGVGAGSGMAAVVTSIPICDVTLIHQSRISDEEENRFQMSVAIYGRELDQHSGGVAFKWGTRELQFRRGVRFQLVNVGAPYLITGRSEFGYPVCRVCGQSVSPFSSPKQREDFETKHKEWCHCDPKNVGFHADLTADALTLASCTDREEAYSLIESLRLAASHVLDMDLEDLQVLVIGRPDREEVDAYLYDPMPGGSGLLEQICGKFKEVVDTAVKFAEECPARCETSCIDCFQNYRNAFYHPHLNRHVMTERLKEYGALLVHTHDIPQKLPTTKPVGDEQPVNVAERKLRGMLLKAGFQEGAWQKQVHLPPPLMSTTPDVTFSDPDDPERKIFIYLDGLSKHLHGNPETAQRDNTIRAELRNQGHEVISITAHDLDDPQAMVRHFKRLARQLLGRDAVQPIVEGADAWFKAGAEGVSEVVPQAISIPAHKAGPFKWVEPTKETMFKTCIPVFDLKIAAGSFSEGQSPEPVGWVEVDQKRALNATMFMAQVVGKSMEPKVPDGSWCLFTTQVGGSRYGRDLVVQHRDISDPETGGSYTLKRYGRPPQAVTEGAERAGTVMLNPLNPAFKPIVIESDADGIRVIAELLLVVG